MRQKKKKKKLKSFNFCILTPSPRQKLKRFFFFGLDPPYLPHPPLQGGKIFFAFLDVSGHLEAIKKNKIKGKI